MTDERLEILVANLLRAGVLLSAAVVVTGGVLYVLRHGGEPVAYHTFHSEPAQYRLFGAIVQGAFAGQGRAIIQLGLLLLIATPVARVVLAIAGFALERDRTYVAITVLVLAILLYSLIGKP